MNVFNFVFVSLQTNNNLKQNNIMLIDNKHDRYPESGLKIKTVWDFINTYSGKNSGQTGKLDLVTGYFTIRALSKLYREIPEKDLIRIVSSEMVRPEDEEDNVIDLLNGDLSTENALQLDDYAKDAKVFLERNSVQIKSIQNAFCHAKAYMFKNNDPQANSYYLTGSSNLTDAGLGLKLTSNVELTTGETVNNANQDFKDVCSWFEDLWNEAKDEVQNPDDPNGSKISTKEFFIKKIEEYFRKYTPEEIYYKILFERFNADLELDNSIEHKKDMSLLQTSVIWNTLFNYQQKGVISLIKMLRKYNGAILADAVGLGKTFSALAVIKYFQTQNYITVLLCPKKLENNWTQYLKRHGSRFEKDEFDYVVRFHTDMQNDRMEKSYDDAKLSWLQTRKKVLVVIDESHNLRNEKSSRYKELLASLIQNKEGQENRDVKVLMLSATPINTGLNDVKGQFNLIGHGKDDAFDNEEIGVASLTNLFRAAQSKYTQWCNDPNRTIGQFITLLPPKFFTLTDKLIVARTRKLIEKTLGENLGFPEKEKPINVYQGVDHFGKFKTPEEIYEAFEKLSLSAYQPSLFLYENRKIAKKEAESDWEDDINRERFLVKMMGILFMKRLESSWASCLQTVKKILDVHKSTLQMVVDYKEHKNNGIIDIEAKDDINDEDDDIIDDIYSLRKGTIKLSEMKNLGGFEKNLRHDINQLTAIYDGLIEFSEKYEAGSEKDLKLEELVKILNKKRQADNKKVVIFTAYSDTAKFVYDELKKRGFSKMATVSGQHIISTGNHSTTNFTEVLQSFAPFSKMYKELDWSDLYEDAKLNRAEFFNDEKQRWEVGYDKWIELIRTYRPNYTRLLDDGIDILIATDCLSEGQNLQDADMQINYDIHWNPVRLIQRFGRIDRIGSPNKTVRCVNFWPAKSVDDYLRLQERVQNRMAAMTLIDIEIVDIDEGFQTIIDDNPLQDKNANRLLEELNNNSISDIESPRTLSLKDFSFEVYRQDLVDYFEAHKEKFRNMPNGIYSGFIKQDDLLENMPESLVAVVGYPHREPGNNKPYQNIYLMCQPIDTNLPAEYQELNEAEVLEFLRKNKKNERFVPEWIETNNSERLAKLSNILQSWMGIKMRDEAYAVRRDPRRMLAERRAGRTVTPLDEKFKLENFDLIVWEYVSK